MNLLERNREGSEDKPMASHSIRVVKPIVKPPQTFHLGTVKGPGRPTLGIDSTSLLRDGQRWLPVMGEIHFSRVDPSEWRRQLLLMRAGGISIIATYLFWIHHEEEEGKWNWTGSRDLRQFVEVCHDLDFPLAMRLGPWCHGECRNGGLPDWVQHGGVKTRSEDPKFLGWTRKLYEQIEKQLRGFLWKDGGPILSAQVDNEFGGEASYLLALKKIAIESGIDVPFYIRTGWPPTKTPLAFGELVPLYGSYAEGFWSRSTASMPGEHWHAFCFDQLRTDVEVGADQLGQGVAKDDVDTSLYPHLMCELGGGMEQSYHRRLVIPPIDTYAMSLTKLGCGNNMPGYYMYHGGTNPPGKTTLHESQATHYANDVPVKSYDFQAPLGQFGQVNESFSWLRRLHLFLHDFGDKLAAMPATVSSKKPKDKHDVETLRWSVRTDGQSGFVFVSNHQRGLKMIAKENVQLELQLLDRTVTLPSQPITIPADSSFIWPFDLKLADATLKHATAQLLCQSSDGDDTYYFFMEIPGIPAEFVIEGDVREYGSKSGKEGQFTRLTNIPATGEMFAAVGSAGRIKLVLLNHDDSLKLSKVSMDGAERLTLCDAAIFSDHGHAKARSTQAGELVVKVFPSGKQPKQPTLFSTHSVSVAADPLPKVTAVALQQAGPIREVKHGSAKVAEAPSDADFETAATWRVEFSSVPDAKSALLLRVRYVGDVARLYLGDEFLNDSFYHTRPFDLALKGLDLSKPLVLKILPLQKKPELILLPSECHAEHGAAELLSVELIERHDIEIKL